MKCFLIDIDGTVANGDHRLHHILKEPKAWDNYFLECGNDTPISHMHAVVTGLSEHFKIVGEAMNALLAFTREHVNKSDDELTIQFLGIRVLNSAAVSIKLALSGYYQAAFVHVRDILETSFLLD